MNVFDFLQADDLANAPHDDPPAAFVELIQKAEVRYREIESNIGEDSNADWRQRKLYELQYDYMNLITGLAKQYQIEPFSNRVVKIYEDYSDSDHRQFVADLNHYVTQIVLGNAIRSSRDTVVLSGGVKDHIRSHLHHIKGLIDKADLTDPKRAALQDKIRAFEAELDKGRTNYWAVARIVFEILSVTANVATLADSSSFHKLLIGVISQVATAKAEQDETRRLAPTAPPPVLTAPRPDRPKDTPRRESFAADLDDEIPF